MFLKIFINVALIIGVPILIILLRSRKKISMVNNAVETEIGIESIKHENASKQVSECIKDAEKALVSANVNHFSADAFLNSLAK